MGKIIKLNIHLVARDHLSGPFQGKTDFPNHRSRFCRNDGQDFFSSFHILVFTPEPRKGDRPIHWCHQQVVLLPGGDGGFQVVVSFFQGRDVA